MSCRYCGTELPEDALFCGECGRAVYVDQERLTVTATAASVIIPTARSVRAAPVSPARVPDLVAEEDDEDDDEWDAPPAAGFSIADLAFSSPGLVSSPDDHHPELPDDPDSGPADRQLPAVARCPQCGEPMAEGDVFCGECGFVLRVAHPAAADSGPPPTAVILLPELTQVDVEQNESHADVDVPTADPTTEVEPLTLAESGSDEVAISAEASESPVQRLQPFELPIAKPTPTTRSRPIPDPFPWGTESSLQDDVEATRIVGDTLSGARFVLQFSTGESVTVTGSGLVGRNPTMQPGEYVDQLVPVFDAGKSVSKTHLEFGQESGRFWVSDRYSTNGSVIRQPESPPRRCDPGRRYFVSRGTRVDVGEQFFVVS